MTLNKRFRAVIGALALAAALAVPAFAQDLGLGIWKTVGGAHVFSTWDPTFSSPTVLTYSSGNKTIVCTNCSTGGGEFSARGTSSHASGHFYFEVTVNNNDQTCCYLVGVANSLMVNTALPSGGTDSGGWNIASGTFQINGATIGTAATATTGVLGIDIDITNKLVYLRVGAAGNWNNSGTANPCTSTGGFSLATLSAFTLFPAWGDGFTSTGSVTINTGGSAFSGTVPACSTAWG